MEPCGFQRELEFVSQILISGLTAALIATLD